MNTFWLKILNHLDLKPSYNQLRLKNFFEKQIFFLIFLSFFWVGQVEAASDGKRIDLFGKLEIKSSLASVPAWRGMLERNKKSPLFVTSLKLRGSLWTELKAKWEDLPIKEKLITVNRFWNQWPYRQDPEIYNKPDYWAAPIEFVKNSGDCEDYAIVKYFTLIELGIPKETMRIAVVMETIRNIAHAVLVVYVDNDVFVLDSLSSQVLSHKAYRQYNLQFSVNEQYKWNHFKGK